MLCGLLSQRFFKQKEGVMPGDRKNPIDGKIIIKYGELEAEGMLIGATIAKVKAMLAEQLPEGAPPIPEGLKARISTMDPTAGSWQAIEAPEEDRLIMLSAEWGMQMFQAAGKLVPDDYVIRKEDVHLEFVFPDEPGPTEP